jgi:AraC-like DNA-binding protein
MGVTLRGQAVTRESQSSSIHFTTDVFGPGEKVAAWCELYGAHVRLDFEPSGPETFSGEARIRRHPGLGIALVSATETGYSRPSDRDSSDDVLLTIMESGRMVHTGRGREVHLRPGDAVLGLSAEGVKGQYSGTSSVIRAPAATIVPLVGDLSAGLNRHIPARTDALRLLRPYGRTLMDCSTTPALQQVATRHVCDLIAILCGASAEGAEVARERGLRAARLRSIKDDIAQNLEDGNISLAAIAARHCVSPRCVQKLFEADGTTYSEYVLEQRLALAHRLLSDPRRTGEKVAAIAFTAGFGDVSYFYRAFRRRYDMLPTDVRAQACRSP